MPGARWTRDENFHLTLRFIGDVDEGVADDVDGALSQPCRTEDRRFLVQLMEGVEEIPAHALEEGTDWDWESFPDYLDALGKQPVQAC